MQPMHNNLQKFLETKGAEYAPFDPSRALRIYECFRRDFLGNFLPKVIHIVGTNGKGSTGRYIALSLAKHYQILHFTSPHLFEFNERFYCNDGYLAWEKLQKAHQEIIQKAYMDEASYFEYATFMALYLARDKDFLILEAGLGGEFDSTNVLSEKISVFTQIGLDHMEFLGDRIEEIARTKLNAMGKIAFIGIQKYSQVLPIAQEIAQKKHARLEVLRDYPIASNFPLFLSQNFALAQKVLEFLGVEICGIEELNLIGRMQRVKKNIWLDVGHNLDSALAIADELQGKKVVLVYNAYKQKDIDAILGVFKDCVTRVEIISVFHERIIQKRILQDKLERLKIPYSDFCGFNSWEDYLVFGSFSVVSEVMRQYLER